MESRVEQAVERFKKGCNCAQAVFVTYADRFGLDEGMAMKLSSPFGGGLAGMRHVCGTVSGMSMLAGLHNGAVSEGKEARNANYDTVKMMAEAFRANTVPSGAVSCWDSNPACPKDSGKNPVRNMCVPVLHWSRNTCSADLSVTESAVAEGYGTGYLFFRGELRIGFCTIFAPEIAREMNWKQFIVLLTAILFNAFAYCFASRSPIAFGSETAEHSGLVLTVDCDGGDTACEQGSFGLSNGFSCAYSVLNIKDFHKFISFQPAAESAVVGELRFYESVFNGSVRSGGSLSELRRLNL